MSVFGSPYFQTGYMTPYQQAYQQSMMQMQQQQQPQNSGFVRVQSEMQAKEYPVALGSSITFIDENAPYCYTKSMGISQLEPPVFKRFRLVEEDMQAQNIAPQQTESKEIDLSEYMLKADFETFKSAFEELKNDFEKIRKELM